MELTLAHRILVVLNDYEWEFENALVSIDGALAHIFYEDEDGTQERIATAPAMACMIEWVDLEELGGVDMSEEDEEERAHEH